ncbi:hypothetical protein NEO90_06515, partial [Escherichia coli]|nr:hypothetical protein [Escherichia coli]
MAFRHSADRLAEMQRCS